jgi:hypothetical protein
MTSQQMNFSGSPSAQAPSSLLFFAHNVLRSLQALWRIQPVFASEVLRVFALLLSVLSLSTGIAKADPVNFPPLIAPAAGATADGCSGCLSDYENTPASAIGDAIVSWSFYAMNTNRSPL